MSRSDNNDRSMGCSKISEPDFESGTSSVINDAPGPTAIAAKVTSLKAAALNAVAKRDRIPQTLFWSLLRCEIEIIKKKKKEARLMRELF